MSPRKKRPLSEGEERELAQAVLMALRLQMALGHLDTLIEGRTADVQRAVRQIVLALDGTDTSIQYAAILQLSARCVREMEANPHGNPDHGEA